ncbi:hypothetical protein GCM10009001_16690 [Virgibacillus siamensis]|uniref:DUF4083 domain-containing protein n=1 Tax=Virgibacillus siamensis TaxID=480071 RepID=A0ABN1FZ42_9BACI
MNFMFLILIFIGIFLVFDAIRKVNNNILEQTEELKRIREELMKNNKE